MKRPFFYEPGFSFDAVQHRVNRWDSHNQQRWDYDWSSGEPVRFKNLIAGSDALRVYEGGRVVISRLGRRDPDLRTAFYGFGLTTELTSRITGVKLFTPEGEPIAKDRIQSGILYLDPVFKRVYTTKRWGWDWDWGWGNSIVYPCKGAMPMGGELEVTTRNKEKEQDLIRRLGDTLKVAETLFRLSDNDTGKWNMSNVRYFKEKAVATEYVHDPMQQLGRDALLGCGRMIADKTFNKWVQKKCDYTKKYEYFNYVEK